MCDTWYVEELARSSTRVLIHTSWVLDEAISSWYCQLRCGSSRGWHGLQRVVEDEFAGKKRASKVTELSRLRARTAQKNAG